MERLSGNKIRLGVCYYPEHWAESLWEDDLNRMKANGIEVVRVAEFAWCLFEPEEGKFCFDLFDRFLALAEKCGMQVIFCTPTATPPAWLTAAYPEVLNAQVDGTQYRHGLRRHYSYNSERYRALTRRIVEKLGEHYGEHPQIIGWQIDNELNCETDEFHSEADHAAFREYLREKYQTLDNLNEKLGNVVWSQNYSDWSQVFLRRPTIGEQFNPHMLLEEKRFFSWSVVRYTRLQCDALRPYIGGRFITTNGIFRHFDYTQTMGGDMDFLCYDSYPNFAYDMYAKMDDPGSLRDRKWSRSLSLTRSLSPAFGIMEQQSGANGWTGRMEAPAPKRGQMRLWAFQSVAHGADFISFFRWRTAPCGTEIYWHGLNDYDNRPNRRMEELARINADFAAIREAAGARYQAGVAILLDYDNEWDAELDRWHGRLEELSQQGWFRAAQRSHTPLDYVRLASDTTAEALARYALVIVPHAVMLTERMAALLREYAEGGGRVLFGARTGYKDEYGRCPMRPMPGLAGELCGVRVSDYTFIGPYDAPGKANWDGETLDAPLFRDTLETTAPDARVLAVYAGGESAGLPALVARPVGKGMAYAFGAAFSEATADTFLRRFGLAEPYRQYLTLPAECELAVRRSGDALYLFALNYTAQAQAAFAHVDCRELLTDAPVAPGETLMLPPYGVAVLRAREIG